jgi:hypothetical protein
LRAASPIPRPGTSGCTGAGSGQRAAGRFGVRVTGTPSACAFWQVRTAAASGGGQLPKCGGNPAVWQLAGRFRGISGVLCPVSCQSARMPGWIGSGPAPGRSAGPPTSRCAATAPPRHPVTPPPRRHRSAPPLRHPAAAPPPLRAAIPPPRRRPYLHDQIRPARRMARRLILQPLPARASEAPGMAGCSVPPTCYLAAPGGPVSLPYRGSG